MADTLDVITLTEAHAAINLSTASTDQDLEIASFVTAVSRRFDAICGPVVARTTTELHDGCNWYIRPRLTPVYSVVSVTEYANTTPTVLAAESNTTKSSSDYLMVSKSVHNVKLYRRASNASANFATGVSNVAVVYLAGRALTTATVDAQFKRAAALTVQHLWNSSAGAWTRTPNFGGATEESSGGSVPPWDIPRAALLLLEDQIHEPSVA